MTRQPRGRGLGVRLGALGRDCRGVALIEFAYLMPVFLLLGLGGVELTWLITAHLRLNQIAIALADNISRAKQETGIGAPRLREYDIQDAFRAALRQGSDMALAQRGRMIVSSLEVNAQGGQWIHWQRCTGAKTFLPQWGAAGAGITGTAFPGMGPVGNRVTAEANSAIMFVELAYDYRPIVSELFGTTIEIRKSAAMYVRDNRDLTAIANPAPAVAVASC
jgi:hypothetical protein